jgi:hypothetical protein
MMKWRDPEVVVEFDASLFGGWGGTHGRVVRKNTWALVPLTYRPSNWEESGYQNFAEFITAVNWLGRSNVVIPSTGEGRGEAASVLSMDRDRSDRASKAGDDFRMAMYPFAITHHLPRKTRDMRRTGSRA